MASASVMAIDITAKCRFCWFMVSPSSPLRLLVWLATVVANVERTDRVQEVSQPRRNRFENLLNPRAAFIQLESKVFEKTLVQDGILQALFGAAASAVEQAADRQAGACVGARVI